jgi:hypothetical protein
VTSSLLLFIGGPGAAAPRSWRLAWNLGHPLCFAAWTALWTRRRRRSPAPPFSRQAPALLLATLLLGLLVEIVQDRLGRSLSLADLAGDLLGTLAVLACSTAARASLTRRRLGLLRGTALLGLLLLPIPLVRALADEAAARRSFPVLAGFEFPGEASRWAGSAEFSRTRGLARQGRHSLRVVLGTGPWSGIELRQLSHDWRGFHALRFSVFHSGPGPLTLRCRIHDGAHEAPGRPWTDRYNSSFTLAPGWNDLRIELEAVAAAPPDRRMDLGDVRHFGLFVKDLPQPRVIHLDDVRLER